MATAYGKERQMDMDGLSLITDEVSADKIFLNGTEITATAAELNQLDASAAGNTLTRGAGVDTAESYATSISRSGNVITTTIAI